MIIFLNNEDIKEEINDDLTEDKEGNDNLEDQEEIKDTDTESRYPYEDLTDEGHITKNYDLLDVALLGILEGKDTELSEENINLSKSKIPEGGGVWILEDDREALLNLINSIASKEYYFKMDPI